MTVTDLVLGPVTHRDPDGNVQILGETEIAMRETGTVIVEGTATVTNTEEEMTIVEKETIIVVTSTRTWMVKIQGVGGTMVNGMREWLLGVIANVFETGHHERGGLGVIQSVDSRRRSR